KNLQRPRYAHRKRPNGRPQRAVPDGPERFRYAPKRFALRAPLGLRCSALPHPERGERNTYTTQTEHKRRVQAHELTITHADRSRANKSDNFTCYGQLSDPLRGFTSRMRRIHFSISTANRMTEPIRSVLASSTARSGLVPNKLFMAWK